MKSNCPSCCKRCCFYHGANEIVCAIHPYGPISETCSDFAPKVNSLDNVESVKDWLGIRKVRNWDDWIITLIISLLFSFGGSCFMVWRIKTYSLTAPTTTTELSIGRNANKRRVTSNKAKTDVKQTEQVFHILRRPN